VHEPCQIRSMTEQDLPMVLAWRNHPDVRRFMFTQHEISLAEHSQWFHRVLGDHTRSVLIVEENANPIGCVQFTNLGDSGVADWGFYVRPETPKGTGRKLGVTALNHAFTVLQLHKVCGQAIASNRASINFHERLGFKQETELREQKRINNQYHTLICFGLLANEWKAELKEENR
jgi:UDP-4-amino-4,6-dideoxy-N-acetyl-beta-L-altrosamine N-acetyltransferase